MLAALLPHIHLRRKMLYKPRQFHDFDISWSRGSKHRTRCAVNENYRESDAKTFTLCDLYLCAFEYSYLAHQRLMLQTHAGLRGQYRNRMTFFHVDQ